MKAQLRIASALFMVAICSACDRQLDRQSSTIQAYVGSAYEAYFRLPTGNELYQAFGMNCADFDMASAYASGFRFGVSRDCDAKCTFLEQMLYAEPSVGIVQANDATCRNALEVALDPFSQTYRISSSDQDCVYRLKIALFALQRHDDGTETSRRIFESIPERIQFEGADLVTQVQFELTPVGNATQYGIPRTTRLRTVAPPQNAAAFNYSRLVPVR